MITNQRLHGVAAGVIEFPLTITEKTVERTVAKEYPSASLVQVSSVGLNLSTFSPYVMKEERPKKTLKFQASSSHAAAK